MRQSRVYWGAFGAMAVLAVLPASSDAARVTLRRDSVIPVVFNDSLTLNGNRAGDPFTVKVDDGRDLPRGTKLLGRVRGVRRGSRDDDKGHMDLEFTTIVLPNGDSKRIYAVPVPLNDKYTSRDSEGRFRVKRNVKKRGTYAIGGALGGLVLGSLMKKPLEGAIVGAVAGIIAAEVDKKDDGNTVVMRGTKMGALIERDITLNIDDSDFDRYDDRYNRNDDEGYDRRDDRYGLGKEKKDPKGKRGPEEWDDDVRGNDDIRSDRDIVIRFRDRSLRFDQAQRPFRRGETVMVPLQATARQMRLEVDPDEEFLFVRDQERDQERVLRLEIGSRTYRLNGRQGTLRQAVMRRNGVVYVPAEILSDLKDEKLSVSGNELSR